MLFGTLKVFTVTLKQFLVMLYYNVLMQIDVVGVHSDVRGVHGEMFCELRCGHVFTLLVIVRFPGIS